MSTALDNLCHNLVKDGRGRKGGEPFEQVGQVLTGGAGVPLKALGFFEEVCARHVCQEGCTGLGGDVMGKASDVDGGVQGATWNATAEAVSSGTDASVIAGAGGHFSRFHGVGAVNGKDRRHGRDLGERRAADHREKGEDAEDGEQKRHAIHVTDSG